MFDDIKSYFSKLTDFFVWLWNCISSSASWFLRGWGLIATSIVGMVSSIGAAVRSCVIPNTLLSDLVNQSHSGAYDVASYLNNAPPFFKIACYVLSIDVLFDFLLSCLGFIMLIIYAVLTFACFAGISYVFYMIATKLTINVAISVLPSALVPNFLKRLSGYKSGSLKQLDIDL